MSICLYGKQNLDFLGFNIYCDRLLPTYEKCSMIQNFLQPKTVKELRRFLGLINPRLLNKYLEGT